MEMKSIYGALPKGEKNAVSLRSLAAMMGLSERHTRRRIAEERKAGVLILSSTEGSGGYYRPGSVNELRRFVRSMEHRGQETFAALEAARSFLAEFEALEERA